MPGSWSGIANPTGYEVGRKYTLSDKPEFTETKNWRLIAGPHTRVSVAGPHTCDRVACGAGVRKPPWEETAGRKGCVFSGARYGDLNAAVSAEAVSVSSAGGGIDVRHAARRLFG